MSESWSGARWREHFLADMTGRGWRVTLISTVAASALVANACSNEDTVPAAGREQRGGNRSQQGGPEKPAISVVATAETDPVRGSGDAADDPAIWVDPQDPSRSVVIGTDKESGLAVYDLSGRELQYRPDGRMDNVDLRTDVRLADASVALVTASDRSDNSIAIYQLDPERRTLEDVAARKITPDIQTYGSCMYHSAETGKLYYYVDSEQGEVEQWELFAAAGGKVDGRRVRELDVGSKTEGCVADDDLGRLYLAEENVGIWRYGAEPDDGGARKRVDSTGGDGHVVADVEGLAVSRESAGSGYLVASSQGDSSFALYRRDGDNPFVRRFQIGPGHGIDGTEDTDGIDVTAANLGPMFPQGLFVAQDGSNEGANQNFKLVRWDAITGGS